MGDAPAELTLDRADRGVGAVTGILLGYALIAIAGGIWREFPIQASATWTAAVLALALVAGAGFGLMPARRAAGLAAVDALRGRL